LGPGRAAEGRGGPRRVKRHSQSTVGARARSLMRAFQKRSPKRQHALSFQSKAIPPRIAHASAPSRRAHLAIAKKLELLMSLSFSAGLAPL